MLSFGTRQLPSYISHHLHELQFSTYTPYDRALLTWIDLGFYSMATNSGIPWLQEFATNLLSSYIYYNFLKSTSQHL